jgi:hypothetical protein
MAESENQFSFTRAAYNVGGAKKQFLILNAEPADLPNAAIALLIGRGRR